MCHIHTFGLDQHPVYRRDSNTVIRRYAPNPMSFLNRHLCHVLRQRKRRDLDRIVAGLGDKLDGVVNRPALENLIANGKLHFVDWLKPNRQTQSE